jgi:hypothetical protein
MEGKRVGAVVFQSDSITTSSVSKTPAPIAVASRSQAIHSLRSIARYWRLV